MQIYPIGLFALDIVHGDNPSLPPTYCCVLDAPQEKSCHDAFNEMVLRLGEKGIGLKHINLDALTVIDQQNKSYTLAHEITIANGSILNTPSNILRHAFSRHFTVESFYLDENDNPVDLTQKSEYDYNNRQLKYCNKETLKLSNLDPNIMLSCLELRFIHNFYWSTPIENLLYNFNNDKLIDFDRFITVFKKHSFQILSVLDCYAQLKDYLLNRCGLEFNAVFNPKEVKRYPESLHAPKIIKQAKNKWDQHLHDVGILELP